MTDPADCGRLAQAALKEFGRIDVLVNNAGVASAVPALKEDPEEFAEVVAVNLQGSFNMAKAAAGGMRTWGEHHQRLQRPRPDNWAASPRPPTRPARQRFSA